MGVVVLFPFFLHTFRYTVPELLHLLVWKTGNHTKVHAYAKAHYGRGLILRRDVAKSESS